MCAVERGAAAGFKAARRGIGLRKEAIPLGYVARVRRNAGGQQCRHECSAERRAQSFGGEGASRRKPLVFEGQAERGHAPADREAEREIGQQATERQMEQREGVVGGQPHPGAQVADAGIVREVEKRTDQRRQPYVTGQQTNESAARRRGGDRRAQATTE